MSKTEEVYIVGCFFSLILTIFTYAAKFLIRWITKSDIYENNLIKIGIYPPEKWSAKNLTFEFSVYVLASWLTVCLLPLKWIWVTLNILRELFTPIPEVLKSLKWPLFNNPDMNAEAVCAHLLALQIKSGKLEENGVMLGEFLKDVKKINIDFNYEKVFKALRKLDAVDVDTIKTASLWVDVP